MPTRQERLKRHQMAEEARAKLKSGQFNRAEQPKGYQTRQQLADAYRAAHPAPPEPTPVGSSFSGDPRTMDLNVPNALDQFQQAHSRPVVEKPFTGGSIPDSQSSLRSTFDNKPVDSRLLPGNNSVRASELPKKKNPIVAGYDQLVHGMQTAINFQQQPTEEVPSTGSKGLDKFLRVTGGFLPGLASGAPLAGNLASDTGSVVQRAGNTLAPKLASKAFQASPQAAYAIQKSAPVVSKVAGNAVGAGVENAAVGAAAGQTDANQVGENFGMGVALGGAGSAIKEASMPLLSKAGRAVMDRFKKTPAAAPEVKPGQLALPPGRPRGNANGAQTPDVITPDYQFKLPLGDEYGRANRAAAHEDLQTINREIAHLNGRYEAAVNAEFKYLQDTAKQGKTAGQIHFDEVTGDVVGRTGWQSKNEKWYRDFYAEHGRAPSKKEMMTLARQRVENGFVVDEVGNMAPSWLDENDFHNTMEALTSVRDELTKSLNQAESKLSLTDAKLADKAESFTRKPVAADLPKQAPELPKQAPKAAKVPGEAEPLKPKQSKPKAEPTRSNYETMQQAEGLSPELKKEIAKNDARYEPITNKETVAAADTAISKKGVDKAVIDFLARESTDAQHVAEGYRLMQILDARAEHEAAARVAAKVAEDLTKAGQQAQAGRIIKKLSPEGQSLALARVAKENGKVVAKVDQKNFSSNAKVRAETMGADLRTNAVHDTVDSVKAGKKATAEDIATVKNTIERAKKQLPAEKPKSEKPAATKRDKVLEKLQAAEDEAWKRIKARRNIGFTPGKGNEIVDYAIIAANRVARGTIKASNHVEQLVKLFGEDIRPHATKIYNMSLKHVARHPELKTIKQNIKTAEQVVEQWAKKTSTSGKDLEKVRELAKAVGSLEGKKGKHADVVMQQIMNKYEKSSITDRVQALRFMAMLGNSGTQLLNASSNLAIATLKNSTDVLGAMLDMSISAALKKPRTTTAIGENPFSFLGHMFQNMWEGGKANWKGVNPGGLHSVSELRGLAFKSKYNPLQWAERSLRAVAGGADYGIYKTQFDNEILKQARLAAKGKKLTGAAKEKFIRDFRANPPSEALEIADNVGKETTFQQKNSLGDLAANSVSALGNLKGKGRIPGKVLEQGIRAVVPFVRTPLNILETGVSLTPGGLIRGSVQLITAKTAAQQREAITHLGLGITGTGMSAAGYYLHKIGVITGANDSGNARLDEVRTESGRGAYRFNQSGMLRYLQAIMGGEKLKDAEKVAAYQEGDRTFNYNKLQPIAFPVALGAGIQEGGLKSGLEQAGGSLLSMSMLKSIQDAVSTGYSGSDSEKQLSVINRVAESYLKSFSPSLLAQEARREDTTQRQTSFNQGFKKDLGDYYKSRIPSLGGRVPEQFTSKSLPAKVTPLGQTKEGIKGGAVGAYLNPYQSDIQQYSRAAAVIGGLIDRTGDDSIAPSAPSKKIKDVTIPPKRYEQYQRDIGNEIAAKVLEIGAKDIGDEEKVKRIAQIMLDTKSKYRDKLKRELGIKDKLR